MSRREAEPQPNAHAYHAMGDAIDLHIECAPIEPDVFVDTWGIKFDHMLGMIYASESYFAENPDQPVFTYIADKPGDDTKHGDQYMIHVTPQSLHPLKKAALGVYEDLKAQGEFAGELAADILKSWQPPAEIELVPGKEAHLER